MSCSLPPEGDENISVWLVSHEEVEEGDNMKLSWIVLALKDDFFFQLTSWNSVAADPDVTTTYLACSAVSN